MSFGFSLAIRGRRRFTRIVAAVGILATCGVHFATSAEPARQLWRIMPVGDSITQGTSWRPVLADKLKAAGVGFEYVGSQGVAPLRHEGYGGKNVEFLAKTVPANFSNAPADIVLLHCGHNHFAEEKPVPGMIAATERLIVDLRSRNPRVVVLLAQVIPSGKLPKYSYIPEFNVELGQLARRLHSPAQAIVLVDQSAGFDWTVDTGSDLVHPTAAGGAKIAQRWFEALVPILSAPRSRN